MGDQRKSLRAEARVIDRETKALTLFLSGATYERIAEQAGYASRGSAHRAIRRAVAQRRQERNDLADEALTVALERLDMLFRTHVTTALNANHPDRYKATDRLLAVMDRMGRLQGLFDQPVQVEAIVRVKDELDDEIASLVRKLKGAAPGLPDTPALDSIADPDPDVPEE